MRGDYTTTAAALLRKSRAAYGMLTDDMEPYSLYLHVPFCRHRCSYCDFNTFAGQERLIDAYVAALCQEIRVVSAQAGDKLPVHTVFFGGGTPSLLRPEMFAQIFETLRAQFDFTESVEMTIEANPGTVSPEYLSALRSLGLNRLSYGMQSSHPDDLRLLERQHDFFDVQHAVDWARKADFTNISLDLIFGLPGQDLPRWKDTLARTMAMHPDHISLYSLTIEHGTPLYQRWRRGLIPLVDEDVSADMYEYAMQFLDQQGFEQYEISNWARRDAQGALLACRHNLQYWQNRPYLGLGAGAHGSAAGKRTVNVGGIRPYIQRCQTQAGGEFPAGPAARRVLTIDRRTQMQETMMVGLRLTQEGISKSQFAQRFGVSLEDSFAKEIAYCQERGLLEWVSCGATANLHLRLTERGRMMGNQVFMQFVGD